MAGVHSFGADDKEDSSATVASADATAADATAADATADVNLEGASDRDTGDQAKGGVDRKTEVKDDEQVTPGVKKS